jgi:hypothetical protein
MSFVEYGRPHPFFLPANLFRWILGADGGLVNLTKPGCADCPHSALVASIETIGPVLIVLDIGEVSAANHPG